MNTNNRFSLSCPGAWPTPAPPRSRGIPKSDPNSTVDVIVPFHAHPTEAHHRKVGALGGRHKAGLGAVKGALYSLPAAAIQQLADDPDTV